MAGFRSQLLAQRLAQFGGWAWTRGGPTRLGPGRAVHRLPIALQRECGIWRTAATISARWVWN